MAGRLITPPVGLGITSIEPMSGPRTLNSGATEAIGSFLQTFASPFGLWRLRLGFNAMNMSAFREYRGWITALHGGANATRFHFFDPDMMLPNETGFDVTTGMNSWTSSQLYAMWSNGLPWENGEPWDVSAPQVPVAAAAAKGATEIRLDDPYWGHNLGIGSYIGFFPLHFGMYTITEKNILDPGWYRIWPPLRKAIAITDYATLDPTIALRLESEEGASVGRGLQVADSLSATFVEVEDEIVREWFTE